MFVEDEMVIPSIVLHWNVASTLPNPLWYFFEKTPMPLVEHPHSPVKIHVSETGIDVFCNSWYKNPCLTTFLWICTLFNKYSIKLMKNNLDDWHTGNLKTTLSDISLVLAYMDYAKQLWWIWMRIKKIRWTSTCKGREGTEGSRLCGS